MSFFQQSFEDHEFACAIKSCIYNYYFCKLIFFNVQSWCEHIFFTHKLYICNLDPYLHATMGLFEVNEIIDSCMALQL